MTKWIKHTTKGELLIIQNATFLYSSNIPDVFRVMPGIEVNTANCDIHFVV